MNAPFRERVYSLLLSAVPHDFRGEYGSEMLYLFRRRARDENFALLWIETIADIASTAIQEHLHMLSQDVTYALRTLRRAPVFAAAAILTLALGVGSNTAIFSVINAVMLRPLPFHEPDRLVRIWEMNAKRHIPYFEASTLNYLSWKEQNRSSAAIGAFAAASQNLTGSGEPERLSGGTITASVFPLLGIRPILGRSFLDEEERPGAARVAIIGEGLWRRRFGADPAIIGRSVELNGAKTEIVGVAPSAFAFPAKGEVWTPLRIDPAREDRGNRILTVIARLKAGVSAEQALLDMKSVAASLESVYPSTNSGWSVRTSRFYEWIVPEDIRRALLVLFGAVLLVLLTSCVNVANLLLARAVARSREIAVRLALGASRRRIARQLLTESGIIALCGGIAGLLLAWWSASALKRLLADALPRSAGIQVDGRVLVFALAISLLTGLLFGVAPVYQTMRADLSGTLKEGSRTTTAGRLLLRRALVVAEVAMATMLVIGASLLVQSFGHLQRAQLGFQPDHLLTAQISLPGAKYPPGAAQTAFYSTLLERLQKAPGVISAAISSGVPMGAGDYTAMSGRAPRSGQSQLAEWTSADWRMVSAGYFKTMGIPLLRGRGFEQQDTADNSASLLISAAYARRLYGTEDAAGREFELESGDHGVVVGVVGDVRLNALDQAPSPAMYFLAPRSAWVNMTVVVRTSGDPARAAGLLRAMAAQIDPLQPIYNVRTMEQWIDGSSAQSRSNALLLTIFGCVALALAAVGVYGVLAYSVNQRIGELGVRIALGAHASDIMRLVLGQGMITAAAGLVAGAAGALALQRALAGILFGISAHDVPTFATVLPALALVSFAACSLPAWRAARIDPVRALRHE